VAIRALPRRPGIAGARVLRRLLERERDARIRRLANDLLFDLY
jgi:hypothetical protein